MHSRGVLPTPDAVPKPGARAPRRRPPRPARRRRGGRGAAAGRARGVHGGRARAADRRAVEAGGPDHGGAGPPPDEPAPRTRPGAAAGCTRSAPRRAAPVLPLRAPGPRLRRRGLHRRRAARPGRRRRRAALHPDGQHGGRQRLRRPPEERREPGRWTDPAGRPAHGGRPVRGGLRRRHRSLRPAREPVAHGGVRRGRQPPLRLIPDYPKYAVWPDGYYVTTGESVPAVYVLERARMLAGLSAGMLRFTAPPLDGFSFQALTPADIDGSTSPPAGTPAVFIRHRDDELHDPGSADPMHDFLDLFALHADLATPPNSTFTQLASVPVAEFDSALCPLAPDASCLVEPARGIPLDAIREVVMWRAQYRNFGAYQTLVGNFVVDVDGTDHGGIRWFELRRTELGAWSLFQEGTWAPDGANRWLGSIAMDRSGNLALGYRITSATVFPGIGYTG